MRVNILDKRLRSIFVSVFLIVCIISTTITFLLPEVFASTARLHVRSSWHVSPDDFTKVLNSDAFLASAVDHFDLKDVWGKKYDAMPMAENDAMKLLRSRLKTSVVSESGIISVTIFGDDPHEAAQLANWIAKGLPDFMAKNTVTGGDDSHPVLTPDMVEMAEVAVPVMRPVRPNKPLDITIGIVFGLLLASGVTTVVGLFVAKGNVRVH
jgi:capsular polysaccharide biosynthesis protein